MTFGFRPKFRKGGQVDQPLEDLIVASNYKQALALCDKRLKKSTSYEEDAVTRCHVLLLNPDSSKQEIGHKSLEKLLKNEPPLRSIFALTAIVEFAHFRGEQNTDIDGMWARALKAYKVDEAWFQAWFKTFICLDQWPQAAQAATRYMQQFKDSHHAFFVAILAKFLDSIMPHDEKSAFSGPVAYKLLSTAVDEARGTKVQFKIPILTTLVDWYKPTVTKERGIKTSQDLLLLLEVYTSQRKHTEALKILDDEWYSDNASFGRRDWEFARHKLELLDLAGFRTRQWEFCTMLLNDALPDDLRDPPQFRAFEYGKAGDDWLVWKGLLSAFAASDQTKKEARRSRAEELINSFEQLPDPRNAKLAAVALLEPRTDGFFERLCSFIRIFCAKQTCFRDIRPYIEQIRQDQQWPLLQYVAQCAKDLQPSGDSNVSINKWIVAETTALKLDYYFGISQRNLSCDAAYYRSFIATCLRLCKISKSAGSELPATDRRPTDDAMILAIMAMHRYARDYGIEQDFKMVALLEHLLKQSKHNYEALLLAVQLYLDLGFGSLAMEYYSCLNIKNIQQGSMPWALMTRISLIHPLPIAEQQLQRKPSVLAKPLQEIHTALAWYESAEEKLMSFIQTSLDSESYHMVHHAISLRRKTMHGFNRHMLFLEGNRIARFASEQEQDMRCFDGLFRVFEDVSLSEDRDHSAFADYEFGEQRDKSAYRGKLTRPFPQLAWFKMLYEQCRCWGYMTRTTKDTAESLCALFGSSRNTDLVATANGFTTSEEKAFTEIGIITALALVDRSTSNTPEVAQVLEHIFISQVEGLKFLEDTRILTDEFSYACEHLLIYGWEWLSHRFLFIDTCHFIKVVSVMLIGEYINKAKAQEIYLKALRLRLNVESASTVLEDQVLQVREKLVEDRELDRVIEWMVTRMPSQETVNGKEAGYEEGAEDSEDSIGALLLDLMNEEDVRQAAKDLIESWAEALYGLAQVAKRLSADKPASGK